MRLLSMLTPLGAALLCVGLPAWARSLEAASVPTVTSAGRYVTIEGGVGREESYVVLVSLFEHEVGKWLLPKLHIGSIDRNGETISMVGIDWTIGHFSINPHVLFGIGYSLFNKTTERISSSDSIHVSVESGWSFKEYFLFTKYNHWSSGGRAFGRTGLNRGEDFISIGIGVGF